ncbi:MAG: hypothetical protein PHT94_03195 [Candidatus Nanoarchaeia archaeon]|nr:hypothetical protein [Candidatus Nanoarchaeia archaeon]
MQMKHKKAESGIGTLIVFIAMILVAAVAAGVLIQTSTSLQSKALDVGKKTQEEVSSGIKVEQVIGADGSDQEITDLKVYVRLNSGATPLKFSDLLLKYDTDSDSRTYVFNSTQATSALATETEYAASSTDTQYFVTYLEQSDQHVGGAWDSYLLEGDYVVIQYRLAGSTVIAEDDAMKMTFIGKSGIASTVDFSAPNAFGNKEVLLYP